MSPPLRCRWIVYLVWSLSRLWASAQSSNLWDLQPSIYLTERPLALPQTPILLKSLVDASELASKWSTPASLDEWQRRQPVVATKFRRTLGLEPFPERTPLNARIVNRHAFEEYAVENVLFESRPGFFVTGNLYLPLQPAPGRRPAVVSPIGHFLSAGKTATDVQARCIGLAKRGFVVLAYDAIGQGERMFVGNIHHEAGYALLPLGQTIAGWMVWDSMRAVDYLTTREDVDPARIGITGNSGGGLNSLFTAAVDERIACAVVVGFTFEFSNWLKYGGTHCTCTHLPGVFEQMDWFEIGGLIGPRPFLMIQGANDGIFPVTGARRSGERVTKIYELLGQRSNVRFEALSNQPHAYSRPFREVMYGWMTRKLDKQGAANTGEEAGLKTLPEKDPQLLCDPTGDFMSRTKTVVDLAKAAALERMTAGKLSHAPKEPQPLLDQIGEWLKTPEGGASLLAQRVHRRGASSGGTWEMLTFNSEDGLSLPALLWIPTNHPTPPRCVIVADSLGKAAFAKSGWVEPLMAQGVAVLAVDLRGRGETLGRYGPTYDTNFRLVANQVLSGSPLAGRRAYDILRAIDYLETRQDVSLANLAVAGFNEDALPALLAAARDSRIQRLALTGFLHSFASQMIARTPPPREKMGDAWNDPQLDGRIRSSELEVDLGSVLPGVLNVGDIPELIQRVDARPLMLAGFRDATLESARPVRDRFSAMVLNPPKANIEYLGGTTLSEEKFAEWIRTTRSR